MLTTYKTLLRPATLGAVALTLTACATLQEVVKEPNITVQNVAVKAISLTDMQLDFDLGVENPNPIGLSLRGLSYQLDVDDKSLLSGDNKQKMKVGANSTSSITLPLNLNYNDMSGGLKSLLTKDKINYSLNGKLDFGLFRLPYSKSGSVDLPSMPSVSVDSVKVGNMGLSGLDLVMALKVSNDNSFPIRLDGIDYGLKLANTTVASGKSLGALSVDPGKSGKMNIGLSLKYSELGSLAKALTSGSSIPVALDGKMKLPGGSSLPLNWSGDVGVSR